MKWSLIRNQNPPYIPVQADPLEAGKGLRDTPDAALDSCLSWAPEFAPSSSRTNTSQASGLNSPLAKDSPISATSPKASAAADKPKPEVRDADKNGEVKKEEKTQEVKELPETEVRSLCMCVCAHFLCVSLCLRVECLCKIQVESSHLPMCLRASRGNLFIAWFIIFDLLSTKQKVVVVLFLVKLTTMVLMTM